MNVQSSAPPQWMPAPASPSPSTISVDHPAIRIYVPIPCSLFPVPYPYSLPFSRPPSHANRPLPRLHLLRTPNRIPSLPKDLDSPIRNVACRVFRPSASAATSDTTSSVRAAGRSVHLATRPLACLSMRKNMSFADSFLQCSSIHRPPGFSAQRSPFSCGPAPCCLERVLELLTSPIALRTSKTPGNQSVVQQ